ncbi:Polysaccharide biosynthesis protein [uncultured archaeon]|nr:Polysaccharide biosynthesis protein [uncultured archaeon]
MHTGKGLPMKSEEHMRHSKQVAKGTMLGLAGTVVAKLVSFAYIIYVARAFSQEDVGLFYLSFSVVTLLGIWHDFGLPAALHRYVPFYEGKGEGRKAKDLLKLSYAVNIVSGIALAAGFWLLADYVAALYSNPLLANAIRLLSTYSLFSSIFAISTTYLQSRADIGASQILGNLQNFLRLALVILFFQVYGPSLFSLSISFVLTFVIGAVAAIPFLKKSTEDLPDGKQGLSGAEVWREIVPFGIMLTLLQSFWIIISSSDRVILGYLGGAAGTNEMIAVYSLATQLALVLMVFPSAIGAIFLPVISRLIAKNDHGAVRSVMETSQSWMLFISIPVAVVMIAFSGEMLSGFYGSSYRVGASTLAIFVAGLLFSILTYTVSYGLAAMRLVKIELKVAFVAGAANIILNILLIPHMGIEGAALASAISFFISMLLFNYYGGKFMDFAMPLSTWKLVLAGAVALCLAMLLKPAASYAASIVPAIGSGDTSIYAAKAAYMVLVGLMTAISFALFAALALLAKTFEHEDIAIMRATAEKARVPEQLIALAEKIALFGVENKK